MPHLAVEDGDANPIALNSILLHKRSHLSKNEINTIRTTTEAWQRISQLTRKTPIYAPNLPLAQHPRLSVTWEKNMLLLTQAGITTMGDLYHNGIFIAPDDLDYISNQSMLFKFTYHRLRAAVKTLYPTYPNKPPILETLQQLIATPNHSNIVTQLYTHLQTEIGAHASKAHDKWNMVLETPLKADEWKTCCVLTELLTPNGNLRIIHFKYLHQVYYTPLKLYKYGLRDNATCKRCGQDQADFIHLAWNCDKIRQYWEQVIHLLMEVMLCNINCTPQLCLLCHIPLKKTLLVIMLLLAKRRVAMHWDSKRTPTIQTWITDTIYCKDNFLLYAEELPTAAKPANFWEPLTVYLHDNPELFKTNP